MIKYTDGVNNVTFPIISCYINQWLISSPGFLAQRVRPYHQQFKHLWAMCGNLMLRGKEASEVLQTLCSSKKIYIDRPHLSLLNTVIVQSLSRVQFFATHGMQHARLSCPPLSPRVRSNLCPLSQWCYLTISSFAADFLNCLQSFPESGSFPMSQSPHHRAKVLQIQLQHQSSN